MARKGKTYTDLIEMARSYGVDQNPLFVQSAEQLDALRATITKIHKELSKKDNLIVGKEYVKGRENMCANPLLKELPRVTAEANSTSRTMLEIIKTLGREPETNDKLDMFLNDE